MSELFQNILTASFHGNIVILAVLALRLVLKKTPRKFLCMLWLLAGIRLLLPFEIQSAMSLQPAYEPVTEVQWQQLEDYGHILAEDNPLAEAVEDIPAVTEAPVASPAVSPESAQSLSAETSPIVEVEVKKEFNWFALLPYLWLAVASCFLIYTICSYTKLRILVREAVKIPGGWECDRIETAFILGFIRPRIYIPMGLSRVVRKHILAHERTHLEKGDHWFKMTGFIALAIHWFNPLVWVAYILLCKDIEIACDERVVQFMELQERKEYSAALLNCSTNRVHFAACPVAFGEVSVKARIKSVLSYKKPSFWISLAGVVAIAFVALCLVTSPTNSTPAIGDPDSADAPNASIDWTAPTGPVSEISTLAWAQTLTPEDVDYIDLQIEQGTDKPYRHITDAEEIAEVVSFLNSCNGEFQKNPDTGFGNSWYNVVTKEGKMRCVGKYGDTHMAIGGSIFKVDQSWLDAWPTEGDSPLPEDYNTFTASMERIATPEEEISYPTIHLDGNLPAETESVELTSDEQLMQDWGVLFRVDDDLLTRSGGEVWFAQEDGYSDVVYTTEEYWLEKKTDSGWEALPLLTENVQWKDANYVLSHGMYTMVDTAWTDLYGSLSGGTYRMGKYFTNQNTHGTCTGYAEFEIFHKDASSADETAAIETCFAALEEVKARDHVHYKVTTSSEDIEEVWWNNGDYLAERIWPWDIYPENTDGEYPSPEEITHVTRHTFSARRDGIGYSAAYEDPEEISSKILGMELNTLSADKNGWTLYSFAENLYLSSFEQGNEVIEFPEGDSCITSEKIRFHKYWSDPEEYSTLTYYFDQNGKLIKMEYETHYDDLDGYWVTFEIYDTTAAQIDAIIQPYTENLIVDSFSWEEAKAKYTDKEFNIRENNFVNNDMVTISTPVEAAQRALKEYPNLGDYLSLDVLYDDTARMWKVTIKSYYEYQASEEYRDIYLDQYGVTHLLVYEGPIEWDETRK